MSASLFFCLSDFLLRNICETHTCVCFHNNTSICLGIILSCNLKATATCLLLHEFCKRKCLLSRKSSSCTLLPRFNEVLCRFVISFHITDSADELQIAVLRTCYQSAIYFAGELLISNMRPHQINAGVDSEVVSSHRYF